MQNEMSSYTTTSHVLVVDDEGPNRYSVTKTLQRVGYIVHEAADGDEALEMVDFHEYDVILSDIRMPGMNGVELLRRIKADSPDSIVILMTGYASLNTAVEALRLGAHDYLIKPSSSHDIRRSVARGVERAHNLKRRRRLLDTIKNGLFELSQADLELFALNLHTTDEYEEDAQPEPEPEPIPRPSPPPSYSPPLYNPESVNLSGGNAMQLGPFTVYLGRYQIATEDRVIDLTPTEFDLLLYLAAHHGRVVPCTELVREVRGYTVEEAEAREVIRPHVSNLRRKLKITGRKSSLIVNVRGVGYRLNEKATPI